MKLKYKNALGIMYQGEPTLTKVIQKFVDEFPEAFQRKINLGRENGITSKEGKRYEFEDSNNEFTVSLGSSTNSSKEYVNLYLKGISNDDMTCWPRFEGERLIGYLTMYLYPKEGRGKPVIVSYDYYVKKVNKQVVLNITTNVNSENKETGERLEAYGLLGVQHDVINSFYVVDTNKILSDNRSGSR